MNLSKLISKIFASKHFSRRKKEVNEDFKHSETDPTTISNEERAGRDEGTPHPIVFHTPHSQQAQNLDKIVPILPGPQIAKPVRSNTISKRFKSVELRIPDTFEMQDVRMIFGDSKMVQSMTGSGVGRGVSGLKGVRWRYHPHSRTIVIEGPSDMRIREAVDYFRCRIVEQARVAGDGERGFESGM